MKSSSTDLKKVKPSNSLWLLCMSPKPCEQTTAHIRNSTIDAMEADEIRAVSYRYLQNRSGKNTTFIEIIVWAMFALTISYLLYEKKQLLSSSFCNDSNSNNDCENKLNRMILMESIFLILPLANIAPNVCNTLRYTETKNACANWLTGKLGKSLFKKIESLPDYKSDSLNTLEKLLNDNHIPKTKTGFKTKRQL